MQLPKNKKAILIDDYQECEFNNSTTTIFHELLSNKFGKIISVFDSTNNLLSSLKSINKDFKFYTIKPFGFKKRNELIERYHILKQNPLTISEQNFLSEVKDTFDNVQSVLGDKLMPSYPIYILSIIQALQYKPLKQNETSFGYCYQTLIHFSLHKAGVSNDELDSYFNFLSELAFKFTTNEKEYINNIQMSEFYTEYAREFICKSFDTILKVLKLSKILQEDNQGYKFCYNYILYYLSAKKISEILHKNEGKNIIKKLFDNVEEERNANILVFITHHSKDISFIESSLLSTMIVLESTKPITLEKNDSFYKDISAFAESIKNDFIELSRTPKGERDNTLIKQDEIKRKSENKKIVENNDEDLKKAILPFLQSFRSIEILGQIIKNRKGSLPISQLKDMLTELYTTGFRTIGYYSELLESTKKEILEIVKIEEGESKNEIADRINNFIQMLSFKMCVNVFGKLIHSIGSKELKKIYIEVAENLNTPAAKLVTFSINSYHGSINIKELTTLVNEFKGNIVALRILKFRVKHYVYNNEVDYQTKQKLASILQMTLTPNINKEKG